MASWVESGLKGRGHSKRLSCPQIQQSYVARRLFPGTNSTAAYISSCVVPVGRLGVETLKNRRPQHPLRPGWTCSSFGFVLRDRLIGRVSRFGSYLKVAQEPKQSGPRQSIRKTLSAKLSC